MQKNCEKCNRVFDTNQTQPERVGYEEAIYNNFPNFRRAFDLCEICLVEKIRNDTSSKSTAQE